MRTKKVSWLWYSLCAVLFVVSFSACSDDDDDSDSNSDSSELVGKWRFTDDGVYFLTFDSDGTGIYTDEYEYSPFSYSYKKSVLTLDYGDGELEVLKVLSLSSSELVLEDEIDGYRFTGTRVD